MPAGAGGPYAFLAPGDVADSGHPEKSPIPDIPQLLGEMDDLQARFDAIPPAPAQHAPAPTPCEAGAVSCWWWAGLILAVCALLAGAAVWFHSPDTKEVIH